MRTLLATLALTFAVAAPATAKDYKVDVSRSAYGIPHIEAKDFASLGYGYAWALAEDNPCTVAESYVTSDGERSRYFGPTAGYTIRGNGSSANNLNSDFFYQRIRDTKRVEKLLALEPPLGPKPEIKEGVEGYVAGWNASLRQRGILDPTCADKPWATREIDEMTVYRRFYSLALLASSGVAIDGIAEAAPLTGGGVDPASLAPGEIDRRLGNLGSNAVALGPKLSESGHGMVYGNPHFPWEGPERFYQTHLTIPGELNVAGGSLLGVPLINIGYTNGMAWSHTVSTARRFTPFQLTLVPGSPTTYLVDGQPREMTKDVVKVKALVDGKLEERTRTLYSTHHGPMLTSILGLPIFPWTPTTAFAMGDANETNFGRLLNHFLDVNRAQTVDEVDAILKRYVGIPWVNTVASDTSGKAYYADIGSIPNVSREKLLVCRTPVGIATDAAQRLPILDGSRSACEWDTDADAPAPGIFGPKNLPSLMRDDYVSNMNDSYWLTNPRQPLEGYSSIIGDERTQRTLRTRGGIWLTEEKLAKGETFDLDSLRDTAMSNRVPAAELWKAELVAMCKQLPYAPTTSGPPVSTVGACEALEGFNGRDDLDSKGAILFRRFATRALGATGGAFLVPFSADDPVNTPRGLNVTHPQVRAALGDAINDVKNAGLPLDSPLIQSEPRYGKPVPIHGGPGSTGVFNVITASWSGKASGYDNVSHGSSYVQAVELTPGCPEARTILTYSQATNPASPYHADQTNLYTRKGWVAPPFCKGEMKRARIRTVRVTHRRGKVTRKVVRRR